jgi:MFS transporter, PAT family, beta-lactamase induction signal transducer AmpG
VSQPWRGTIYGNRRMAALAGLGFAAGLPQALVADTLATWLSALGLTPANIGLFSLVALPYALKVLWAPFMDRFEPWRSLGLGRRRSWLLLTQVGVTAALAAMTILGPRTATAALLPLTIAAVLVACCAASQDIVADAYRADVARPHERGAASAMFVTGYRFAMLAGASLAPIIAHHWGWPAAYGVMTVVMAGSAAVTIAAPQEPCAATPPTIHDAVFEPVLQLIRTRGWALATIAAFIVLFKLPDALALGMTPPLLIQQLHFTEQDVGLVKQMLGMFTTIIGALLGGLLVARFPMRRCLLAFGLLQALSNLGFFALATVQRDYGLMVAAIVVENLCTGLIVAGFVAYLMSCCDPRYSATQYALFTSLMALTTTIAKTASGLLVASVGYPTFFLLTILAGIPGLLLIPWLPVARPASA